MRSTTDHLDNSDVNVASRRLAIYTWTVAGFNLLVIVWGAYVRASASGAGCGNHWPLCNGEVIPESSLVKTLVEFAHRATSGAALLLVVGLVFVAFRVRPRGDRVRRGAVAAFVFICFEALIGAALVKFGLVVNDDSAARAVVMSLHLVNTLLLLASLALTGWWAGGGARVRLRGQGTVGTLFFFALASVVVVAVSGAVTALGDTLFPARTLAEGLQRDFSPTAHFLLRLRVLHPALAVVAGCFAVMAASYVGNFMRASRTIKRLNTALGALLVLQVTLGIANVTLLAPAWLQMAHLLVADLFWIALVLVAAAALSEDAAQEVRAEGASLRPVVEQS